MQKVTTRLWSPGKGKKARSTQNSITSNTFYMSTQVWFIICISNPYSSSFQWKPKNFILNISSSGFWRASFGEYFTTFRLHYTTTKAVRSFETSRPTPQPSTAVRTSSLVTFTALLVTLRLFFQVSLSPGHSYLSLQFHSWPSDLFHLIYTAHFIHFWHSSITFSFFVPTNRPT